MCLVCLSLRVRLQVLSDDKGEPHIAFFSKLTLRAGQELTFDYRFKEEEGASRVRCTCGAPNCKVRQLSRITLHLFKSVVSHVTHVPCGSCHASVQAPCGHLAYHGKVQRLQPCGFRQWPECTARQGVLLGRLSELWCARALQGFLN